MAALMGAVFRNNDDFTLHVATGKWPYVAGESHAPRWGEWRNEGPGQMRSCEWGDHACDLDDYRAHPTTTEEKP